MELEHIAKAIVIAAPAIASVWLLDTEQKLRQQDQLSITDMLQSLKWMAKKIYIVFVTYLYLELYRAICA